MATSRPCSSRRPPSRSAWLEALQQGDEISHLLGLYRRPRHLLSRHGRSHHRVVPQRRDDGSGGIQALGPRQVAGRLAPLAVGAVTVEAALVGSNHPSAGNAPAPREVADRIEIGDEIGHVFRRELGHRHVLGCHGLQHGRLLVPDGRRELDWAPSHAHGHEVRPRRPSRAAELVTLHAALLHEEAPTHLRPAGQHEERTLRGAAGGRREVRAQITQLLRGHGRTLDALRLHRLGHGDPMIPHGGGQIHRRGELLQRVKLGPYRAPRPSHRVAHRALLVDEELAARGSIPGPVEVAERVEEADEIARLLARELGTSDPELLHALGHAGQMVPEGRRHVVEGMRARALGEIGTDLTPDAVDRVALLTTLGREHARSRHRVLAWAEHGLRPRAIEGHQCHHDRDSAHHDSDHCGPFLSASDDTTAHSFRRPPMLLESFPDHKNYSNLSLSTPGEYAWRTCALSNTATPKAYSFLGSVNCTSYSLPVLSLRQNTLVRTPSL